VVSVFVVSVVINPAKPLRSRLCALRRSAAPDRDLTVLKWMVASNIGLTLLQLSALIAVLFRLVMAS